MSVRSNSKKGKPSSGPQRDASVVTTMPTIVSPSSSVTSSPKKGAPSVLVKRTRHVRISDVTDTMTEFSLKALVEPFNSPELRSSASGWQGQILNLELVDETGSIQAVAFGDDAISFQKLFAAGQVYEITNPRVQSRNGQLQLILQRSTATKLIAEDLLFASKGFVEAAISSRPIEVVATVTVAGSPTIYAKCFSCLKTWPKESTACICGCDEHVLAVTLNPTFEDHYGDSKQLAINEIGSALLLGLNISEIDYDDFESVINDSVQCVVGKQVSLILRVKRLSEQREKLVVSTLKLQEAISVKSEERPN